MKNFYPKTGSEPEWSAAVARLEDYLRALDFRDAGQREQIILRLLERAAGTHAENPGLCPTTLAMAEVRAALDRSFEQIHLCHERAAVMGMVSLLAMNTPKKWPATFLGEAMPTDFQRAWLAHQVRAVPDLAVASMVPQPFANPLRTAIKLPIPLGKLAQDLVLLRAKAAASVPSLFSALRGVRLW